MRSHVVSEHTFLIKWLFRKKTENSHKTRVQHNNAALASCMPDEMECCKPFTTPAVASRFDRMDTQNKQTNIRSITHQRYHAFFHVAIVKSMQSRLNFHRFFLYYYFSVQTIWKTSIIYDSPNVQSARQPPAQLLM